MAQTTDSTVDDETTSYVVINKDVKPLPLKLAKTLKRVPLPPLAGNGNIFGQEYDIFKQFNCISLTEPSNNLFINTLHYAFRHHLPITIRPDDLWLQILQGLAIHVSQNKNKLQTSIVNFADPNRKINIIVRNDNLKDVNDEKDSNNNNNNINNNNKRKKQVLLESNNINWKSVFEQFSEQCNKICAKNGNKTNEKDKEKAKEKENDEEEKGSIIDWGLCDFSTSNEICKVASQCSLFSVLSNYVAFFTFTCSGIPKIILKGTINDWKLLLKKCQNLKQLQCDFWYPYVTKAVSNIVETVELLAKGKTLNKTLLTFWKSIYHYNHASGGDTVTGWCNAFIPYVFVDNKYAKNSTVSDGTNDDPKKYYWGTHPWDFPSSYTKAPMTWVYYGKEIKCQMVGGIVGVQQKQSDGMVAPIIGWMVKQDA